MARGFLRVYRTYNPLGEQNPVVDKVRTILQDEGLIRKLEIVHELSGVSTSTLQNWLVTKKTKSPQHATIAAVITSLGYQERFIKENEIDIEAERAVAAKWRDKQETLRAKADKLVSKPTKKRKGKKTKAMAARPKVNGHHVHH